MGAPGTTEGPWRVFGDMGDWCGIEGARNLCSIVIWAKPEDEGDDGGVRGATPEEALANAHQMAASGALYDALVKAIEALEECQPGFIWGTEPYNRVETIRAAVMKDGLAALALAATPDHRGTGEAE